VRGPADQLDDGNWSRLWCQCPLTAEVERRSHPQRGLRESRPSSSITCPGVLHRVLGDSTSSHTVASCEPVMPAGERPVPRSAEPTIFQLSCMTAGRERLGQQFLASRGIGGASRTLPEPRNGCSLHRGSGAHGRNGGDPAVDQEVCPDDYAEIVRRE